MSDGKRTTIRRENGQSVTIRDLRSEAETVIVNHGGRATWEIRHEAGTLVVRSELLDNPPQMGKN